MTALIYNELIKAFSKYRTYISFAAILVLLPLVLWGFSVGGGHMQRDIEQQFGDQFLFVGTLVNGFMATYITMNFLWIHIPFLITLLAGDIVAGEGAGGTYRIYLIRPVSRLRIILAKLIATYLYTLMVIVFFALMSLGLGTIWLGQGDLAVVHDGIILYSAADAFWRFLLGFAFSFVNLLVVASLCFMFSALVNNGIGPIIGTMSIMFVGLAITNIPIDFFDALRPWSFTTYFNIWQQAFHDPIPWGEIGTSLAILLGHSLVFAIIAVVVFNRKDILT